MGDVKYNWPLKESAFTFSGTVVVLFWFLHGWQCWMAETGFYRLLVL